MVSQLRKLARTVEKQSGPIALFMLLAPDVETEDAWNLMVSARGLDAKSRATSVKQITQSLRDNIDRTYWPWFARVTVLRTDDPFVKAVNSVFRAKRSVVNLQSINLLGVNIPKAILLQSNKVAA